MDLRLPLDRPSARRDSPVRLLRYGLGLTLLSISGSWIHVSEWGSAPYPGIRSDPGKIRIKALLDQESTRVRARVDGRDHCDPGDPLFYAVNDRGQ